MANSDLVGILDTPTIPMHSQLLKEHTKMKKKFGKRGVFAGSRSDIIPTEGCRYCGESLDKAGRRAKRSRCCQKCFIRLFATPEQVLEYENGKTFLKETMVTLDAKSEVECRKLHEGRLDASRLPQETLAKLRKQARWEE